MASAAYTIKIDFNKDGAYNHARSDVTSYVLEAQWNNGMSNSEQEFAPPDNLRLTLSNNDGAFNLEDSGAAFYGLFKKGLLVRIQATFSSTTYTLYIGKIRELPRIAVGVYSDKRVEISVSGYMLELLEAEFAPELETNVTTDDALSQVFARGVVVFPYTSSAWILDSSVSSVLGTTTILLDPSDAYSFETGEQTLAYVGDTSGSENTVRAQQFLRDVVAAEMGGRFWYDTRNGKFLFHHRHHDLNPTSTVTLTGDDYEQAQYVAQGTVHNEVTVYYYPRSVGTAGSVVWTLDEPIQLARAESKTIQARFQDPDNSDAKIAVQDGIIPVANTDYTANSQSNGGGTDRTTNLRVFVEYRAQSAQITLTNDLKKAIFVTTLQLRATPLKTFGRSSVNFLDADSISSYDRQRKTISINYLDNEEDARGLAGVTVGRYKEPITRYENVMFIANKDNTRMTQALLRTIGDAVTLQFSAINHDMKYVIVGERHRITGGGEYTHECTWILKSTQNDIFWILEIPGYTELGETTILAL